jgi:N-acetylglucosamine malate deacetylase 1
MFHNFFQGRVLLVAAHYDDETIGCAGTLLRFRSQIDALAVVHLVGGPEKRRQEFARVRSGLMVDMHYELACQDGFCSAAGREVILDLARLIQTERPAVVLAPHEKEAHPDHKAAWHITLDAAQKARYWPFPPPSSPHRVPTLMGYEVWTALTEPAVVYDITDCYSAKSSLLQEYTSQLEVFPYLEYLHALNSWRGLLYHRRGQAEAFSVRCV